MGQRPPKTQKKSREKIINDKADALATESRQNAAWGLLGVVPKLFFKGVRIALTINKCVVSKNLKKEITKALHDKHII